MATNLMTRPRPGRPRKFARSYPLLPFPERELTRREIGMLAKEMAMHLLRLPTPDADPLADVMPYPRRALRGDELAQINEEVGSQMIQQSKAASTRGGTHNRERQRRVAKRERNDPDLNA